MDDAARIVEAGYDRLGTRYRDWAASFDDPTRRTWIARLIVQLRDAAVVLDAGCGPGEPTGVALRDAGLRVIALDRSIGQLDLARRLHDRCVRADLCALPLADDSVDAVVALYTCTHLHPAAQPVALAEFARVTRPGGALVVTLSASPVEHGDHDHWLGVDTYCGGLPPDANRAALDAAGWRIADDTIVTLAEPEVETQFHWISAYLRHVEPQGVT